MTLPQRIAVLGGSGFLGRYVVRHLASRGHLVRVVVRQPAQANSLKPSGSVGQIQSVYGSLNHPSTLEAALQDVDGVINLVGILAESNKRTFDQLHYRGPQALAEIAQRQGLLRLVHVSALAANSHSASSYARSKALGEKAVLEAFPHASIVRPSLVFGPEDNFFNLFAHLATLSPVLPLLKEGKTLFQPVYVDDVARALCQLVLSGTPGADPFFELGGPDIFSFRQLLELITTVIQRKKWLLPLPNSVAKAAASILQFLPRPLLTPDQLKLLDDNSVLSLQHPTLTTLGILPTPLTAILPTYLARYRPMSKVPNPRE